MMCGLRHSRKNPHQQFFRLYKSEMRNRDSTHLLCCMHRFDGLIQSGINNGTQNQMVTEDGMHGHCGLLLIRNGGDANDLLSWQGSDIHRFEEQN